MFSKRNNYIILNYHYIENIHSVGKGVFPCSVSDFKRQVKYLSKNYLVTSIADVFESAIYNKKGKFCAITFDDGLKDQYNNALPILEKYNLSATFFIITAVLEGYLPMAHKIHAVLSGIKDIKVCEIFNKFVDNLGPEVKEYKIPSNRRLTQNRLHESVASANFKETMKIIPAKISSDFLDQCLKQLNINKSDLSRQLFMDSREIKDLHRRGMIIGSHSHSHTSMDLMNDNITKDEISFSSRILSEILIKPPQVFSYPHGISSKFSADILPRYGFEFAVTIKQKGVGLNDNPYLIPRYDAASLTTFLNKNNIF